MAGKKYEELKRKIKAELLEEQARAEAEAETEIEPTELNPAELDKFLALKRTEKLDYFNSRMTRISDEAKAKLGTLRAKHRFRSDNAVILTLLAYYEANGGEI